MSTFVCWHQPVLVAPLTRSDCSACTLGSASALAGSYLQRRCPELPHRSACSRWSRCPGRESNPHALSGGSLSDFCVYQFHHLGKKSGEGRIRTYNLLVCSVRVGPGEGTRGHERWVALKAGFQHQCVIQLRHLPVVLRAGLEPAPRFRRTSTSSWRVYQNFST